MRRKARMALTVLLVGTWWAFGDDFSLVILPDTQSATAGYPEVFEAQTAWIASNAVAMGIAAVAHVGDVVDSDVPAQWTVALGAMSALDGVVPYLMTTGNHDYSGLAYTGGSLFNTLACFGPGSAYAGQPTVAFHATNRTDAAFLTFTAGGVDWILLAVPWQAPSPVVEWANGVIAGHPNHLALILAHDYLTASGDTRSSSGTLLWNALVRKHRNALMVFCGHAIMTAGGVLTSVGDKGNTVYQMLSNYQQLPNGGNGWLRIVRISTGRTVSVSTYSPVLDAWNRNAEHEFSFTFANPLVGTRPVIRQMTLLPRGQVELQWESLPASLYQIQFSPSVGDADWTNLVENLPTTTPTNTYRVTGGIGPAGYFRIAGSDL